MPYKEYKMTFKKGYYNVDFSSFDSTSWNLMEGIPKDYYWGWDGVLNNNGSLQSRYSITHTSTSLGGKPSLVHRSTWGLLAVVNGVVKYSTDFGTTWANVGCPNRTSVNGLNAVGIENDWVALGNYGQTAIIWKGGTSWVDCESAHYNTRGTVGYDERRLWISDLGLQGQIYYSERNDSTKGYDVGGRGGYVSIGGADGTDAIMHSVSSGLHVIRNTYNNEVEVYRKTMTNPDPASLLFTQFNRIARIPNTSFNTACGTHIMGGKIYIWLKGIGLCSFSGDRFSDLSPQISTTEGRYYLNSKDGLITGCEPNRLIFCNLSTLPNSYVYDMTTNTWSNFSSTVVTGRNVNYGEFTNISYNYQNGFALLGTRLGQYPTMYVVTPATDFDLPTSEKFIRKIKFWGTPPSDIEMYAKNHGKESYSPYYHVYGNTSQVINFDCQKRFRRCLFKMSFNETVNQIDCNGMTITFDSRREYRV